MSSTEDTARGAAGGAVARLVYASRARLGGSVYAEMERIRASAVRNNVPLGISTALLHQAGWFVQWKEGPGDAMHRLMARVATDPRHEALQVVHSSRGPRLLDGPWSMAYVPAPEPPHEMERRVAAVRGAMRQDRQHSPQNVWRRLSTPVRHPACAGRDDPDALQRVMVCAAAGTGSFRLVRWLAGQAGQPVVQRRFADAWHSDVGADLVDLAHAGRVLRVVAMARNGLALPLTRAFLGDHSHLLVLLSGDPAIDSALVRRLAQAGRGQARMPTLVGVCDMPAAHAAMQALARHLHLRYEPVHAAADAPEAAWEAAAPLVLDWCEAANSHWPLAEPPRVAGLG